MVVLNRIYTRTGDDGTTSLGTGERRKKYDLRIAAYGTLDEVNAAIGLARLHTADDAPLDAMLARIQNDLFDVEADLCLPAEGAGRRAPDASPTRRWRGSRARSTGSMPICAAAVVHPAGRQRRRGLSASRAHGLPPRRADDGRAQRQAGRGRHAGGAQIRQPAVRFPVRRRPPCQRQGRDATCCGCRARTGESDRLPHAIRPEPPRNAGQASDRLHPHLDRDLRDGDAALRRQSVHAADQAGGDLVPDRGQSRACSCTRPAQSMLALERIDRHLRPDPGRALLATWPRAVPASRTSLTLITYMFLHAGWMHLSATCCSCGCSATMSRTRSAACRFLVFYLLVRRGRRARPCARQHPTLGSAADRRFGAVAGIARRLSDAASRGARSGCCSRPHSAADQRLLGDRRLDRCCSSCNLFLGARRARSPSGPISAGCWPAASLFPLMKSSAAMLFQCLQPVPDTGADRRSAAAVARQARMDADGRRCRLSAIAAVDTRRRGH